MKEDKMSMEDTEAVRRPGMVTAVAVMGFVLGGLSLLGTTWVIVHLLFGAGAAAGGVATGIQQAGSRAWMFVSVPIKVLTGAAWIFTGAGLLRMRGWARKLVVVLVIVEIVMDVVGGVIGVGAVRRVAFPSGPGAPPEAVADFMRSAISAGVIGGVVLWLAYGVVMLVLITRRSVSEAFARAALPQQPPRETDVYRQTPPPLPPSA